MFGDFNWLNKNLQSLILKRVLLFSNINTKSIQIHIIEITLFATSTGVCQSLKIWYHMNSAPSRSTIEVTLPSHRPLQPQVSQYQAWFSSNCTMKTGWPKSVFKNFDKNLKKQIYLKKNYLFPQLVWCMPSKSPRLAQTLILSRG